MHLPLGCLRMAPPSIAKTWDSHHISPQRRPDSMGLPRARNMVTVPVFASSDFHDGLLASVSRHPVADDIECGGSKGFLDRRVFRNRALAACLEQVIQPRQFLHRDVLVAARP